MCSIPGLPTPGSQVPVLITRVNLKPNCGLVELWVNLDVGRKHGYEQMKKKIQIPEKKFCGSEQKPGDLCLVFISGTWHRARIVSTHSETCSVFLIDRGELHITTCEALARSQDDSFLLPPEIESCILANVFSLENEWPERATKFLMSLSGKTFNGLVQHVLMPNRTILLEISIISKHMCKIGVAKKIPKGDFKCLVLKCLHLPKEDPSDPCSITQDRNLDVNCQFEKFGYFYPELLNNTCEPVKVTEVMDPQNIFCKLVIFSKALETLSEQIHQHYEETSDFGGAQPQICGDLCAARGINGKWKRSFLKQNIVTSDGAVKVMHVDEGKTEYVPVGDIRPLHGKFLRMPVFTYHFSLNGVNDNGTGWTTDQTDYLKSLLLNNTFVARCEKHNIPQDVYYVNLYAANGACINYCFLKKAGLLPTSKTELHSNIRSDTIPCADVKKNLNVDSLPEETLPSTKNLSIDVRADDAAISGLDAIRCRDESEPAVPSLCSPGHLSTCCPCDISAYHDDVVTVGSTVNVKVSCIESLQRFWCQITENADSLRLLMEGLQNHYASAYPPPLVESTCVARDPENGMWHRARIITSQHSPEVEVRFVDYGQTRMVPLGDVRPIDPAFLQLDMQAFPCSLFNLKTPDNHTDVTWSEAALANFKEFVDSGVSLPTGLKCTVKARTSDEEGLLVNMVDLETLSDSACKLLTQKCAQVEAQVPSEEYKYSTDQQLSNSSQQTTVPDKDCPAEELLNMSKNEVHCSNGMCAGDEPKMDSLSTSLVSVPDTEQGKTLRVRNPTLDVLLRDEETVLVEAFIQEDHADSEVTQLALPTCLEVVENSCTYKKPNISLNKTEEVYASCIVGPHYFWCQSTNTETLNIVVRLAQEVGLLQQNTMPPKPLSPGSPCLALFSSDNQWYRAQVMKRTDDTLHVLFVDYGNESEVDMKDVRSVPQSLLEQAPQAFLCSLNEFDESKGSWDDAVYDDFYNLLIDKPLRVTVFNEEDHSETGVPQYAVEIEFENETVNSMVQKYWKSFPSEHKNEVVQDAAFTQVIESESSMTHLEENVKTCLYKKPNISTNETEEVYASCIVQPNFFWCQNANTEDLSKVSRLAQEAGQVERDMTSPDTFGPGSPCLALFPSDNQWYRAQVIRKVDDKLYVVFIDYGNESDVETKNVRTLPQGLLEQAPQAFLCSLNGFEEAKGTWDDKVYDDFYNLLVDKPLRLTSVFNMEDHKDMAVPQYAVEIECEGAMVNAAMQKYWTPVAKECITTDIPQTVTLIREGQTKTNMTCLNVPKVIVNYCMYQNPKMSRNMSEIVYASCIVGPNFFWCQYANTDDLHKVSKLAQEAGQAEQDMTFPETLGPDSPCLALFSGDNQWYRAQVISRVDDEFNVVFIDYGNETNVDIKDVRTIPQGLLEQAPQAFLCSLKGFDESKGSWDDNVYDDFYNVLIDKTLKVSVLNIEDHSEVAVPQYAVEIECDGVIVNTMMEKHWREL